MFHLVSPFLFGKRVGMHLDYRKIMKRDKILVNAYYFYKKAEESCNHILLWCLVVHRLWSIVQNTLRISWVVSGSVKNKIWAWKGMGSKRKHVEMIQLTIFWVVWKKRNKKAFEGVKDTNGYSLLKNRWFQTFTFLLMGHSIQSSGS